MWEIPKILQNSKFPEKSRTLFCKLQMPHLTLHSFTGCCWELCLSWLNPILSVLNPFQHPARQLLLRYFTECFLCLFFNFSRICLDWWPLGTFARTGRTRHVTGCTHPWIGLDDCRWYTCPHVLCAAFIRSHMSPRPHPWPVVMVCKAIIFLIDKNR